MKRLAPPFLAMALAVGTSCSKPEPEVLHILRPLQTEGGKLSPNLSALALEVLPVHLPEALRRPQLLLETTPGNLRVLRSHRWAGGLDKDIQGVLVENLSRLSGSGSIVVFPYGERVRARYRLEVEVHYLAGKPGGTLALRATWMLCPPQGGQALLVRRSELERPVAGSDPEALVAAHDAIIADLSREIAAELSRLETGSR